MGLPWFVELGLEVLLRDSLVLLEASINLEKEGKERLSERTLYLSTIHVGNIHYDFFFYGIATIVFFVKAFYIEVQVQIDQSLLCFCTKELCVKSRHHVFPFMNRSSLEIKILGVCTISQRLQKFSEIQLGIACERSRLNQ